MITETRFFTLKRVRKRRLVLDRDQDAFLTSRQQQQHTQSRVVTTPRNRAKLLLRLFIYFCSISLPAADIEAEELPRPRHPPETPRRGDPYETPVCSAPRLNPEPSHGVAVYRATSNVASSPQPPPPQQITIEKKEKKTKDMYDIQRALFRRLSPREGGMSTFHSIMDHVPQVRHLPVIRHAHTENGQHRGQPLLPPSL